MESSQHFEGYKLPAIRALDQPKQQPAALFGLASSSSSVVYLWCFALVLSKESEKNNNTQ